VVRPIPAIVCMIFFLTYSIFAQEPLKKLEGYEKEARLIAIGMCDSSRTSFTRFKGKKDEEIVRVDPVSKNRYFIILTKDGKEEFYVERLGNQERIVEQKTTAMEWSMAGLMQESHNFFLYYFFKNDSSKNSDCDESPVGFKK